MSTSGLGELRKLTAGERLFILRRRDGLSQTVEAGRQGVTRFIYGAWELDRNIPYDLVIPIIEKLEPHERCVLYRRRAGKTQDAIAMDMDMSRYWVNLMENGRAPSDDLLWYWEQ